MAIPEYQSLMLPVLKSAVDGEVRLSIVGKSIATALGLSDEDLLELLPSGKQTVFVNRVGWTKTYLVKAGLLKSTRRGHFCLTERGRSVLASNPARIDRNFLIQFDEFRQFQTTTSDRDSTFESVVVESAETPDEIMRSAHQQVEAALAQSRSQTLLKIFCSYSRSPFLLEKVCHHFVYPATKIDRML